MDSRMDRLLECGTHMAWKPVHGRKPHFEQQQAFPCTPPCAHSFTSGLTISSAEPGKCPEVVKIWARDISQASEHAQSVFSSLTLQHGQEVYLMAETLSRTHHNSDCSHANSYIKIQTAAHELSLTHAQLILWGAALGAQRFDEWNGLNPCDQ